MTSYPSSPQVQFAQLTGSARAAKAGAHDGTDSAVPKIQVTTWGPAVESLEHACDSTMTCPCRACSEDRGRLVDKARR